MYCISILLKMLRSCQHEYGTLRCFPSKKYSFFAIDKNNMMINDKESEKLQLN